MNYVAEHTEESNIFCIVSFEYNEPKDSIVVVFQKEPYHYNYMYDIGTGKVELLYAN